MFKKMKHMKNEKGLTLIELLAVIVILAIVAAISIPAIGSIINNQRDKAILSEISGLVSAAKISHADSTCDPVAITTGALATSTVKCEQADVAFTPTKFSSGDVYFDDTGKIVGIANVKLVKTFKGKKAGDYAAAILGAGKGKDDTDPVADHAFTETKLNELMGEK